ncbi:hypothetical protein M4578_04655 [Salipiger sp. P9]|nr:hypothetical protein [Salipiger pentaromativorans]
MLSGACHPLGRALARRLAGFGALVVAIDRRAEPLYALAKDAPQRIEPLALDLSSAAARGILAEAWEREPVHALYDLSALAGEAPLSVALERSAGILEALTPGLRAGRGRAVLALPGAGKPALAAALAALLKDRDAALAPARLHGLRLPAGTEGWTEARCMSSGDLMLALTHPVTRGLAGGRVLTERAETGTTGKERDGDG